MLKRIESAMGVSGACVRIRDATFPTPFASGLEYSAPVRGMWNIVHTGMLLPEAHIIFACAAGCLRGVVLTAAEMNAMNRFSTIEIQEADVLEGRMEELLIDGVTRILEKLPKRPKAVLLYTSCIHHFMGCDLPMTYAALRKKFSDIGFIDCYMTPTLRKSGLTPDQLMRRQLYALVEAREEDAGRVAMLGNDLATDPESELTATVARAGRTLQDIIACKHFEEYLDLGRASLFLTTYPAAVAGGEALAKRLHRRHLYLPASFGYAEIARELDELSDALGARREEHAGRVERCEAALSTTASVLRGAPIAIDYTATSRPLGLARLLSEHGMRVESVYLDAVSGEEKDDFLWLCEHAPDLRLKATVQVQMRVLARDEGDGTLAIGQKAAYFTGTRHFVNQVEGGGLWGYEGIVKLCADMEAAYQETKDARSLIQVKGWGCGCCM